MNVDTKLPKKKLFQALRWYSNCGTLVWYYIPPVYFAFPIGTVNVGFFQIDIQYCIETASCKNKIIL